MTPLPVRVLVLLPAPKLSVEVGTGIFFGFLGVRISFIFPIFGNLGTVDAATCLDL